MKYTKLFRPTGSSAANLKTRRRSSPRTIAQAMKYCDSTTAVARKSASSIPCASSSAPIRGSNVLRLVGQHGLDQLVRALDALVFELAVEQLARDRAVLLGGQQRDRVLLLVAQVEVHQRPLGQQRHRHDALVGREPQALALGLAAP